MLGGGDRTSFFNTSWLDGFVAAGVALWLGIEIHSPPQAVLRR